MRASATVRDKGAFGRGAEAGGRVGLDRPGRRRAPRRRACRRTDEPPATAAGRAALYAWEDAVVAPRDRCLVPFAQLQALVDHVWAAEGLRYPPRIRPLPRQARRTVARATRTAIEAPGRTADLGAAARDRACPDQHEWRTRATATARDFVGMYLRLLVRYARMDGAALEQSLQRAGIAFEADPRPAFIP